MWLKNILQCWILLYFATIPIVDSRRSIMPKIEISMLLEELNSEEADHFLKYSRNTSNNTTITSTESSNKNNNESTTTTSEESENSTRDLIKAVRLGDFDKFGEGGEDYENQQPNIETTTLIGDDYYDTDTIPTPKRPPMLLSEFASHLSGGLHSKGLRSRTTTTTSTTTLPPLPPPPIFTTTPDDGFPFMVTAAKDFIRRYLSQEQWRKLRILLKTIKEVGGTRTDIHRAATMFISKVISKSEMEEITKRRRELFRTFNRRYLNAKKNV